MAEEDRLLEVVRDEEDRHLVLVVDLEQRLVHHRLGERVERSERLIEQQHLRIVHQGAHDLDAPAHAGGDFAREVVLDADEAGVGHHAARFLARLGHAELALHDRAERDVLQVRLPRKKRAVLEHHDAVGPGVGLRSCGAAEHVAVEIDGAAGDVVKAGDGVEQRRLAATRRPDDHADLAGADVERAVGHRLHRALAREVNLVHVLHADRALGGDLARRVHRPPPSASSRTRHCIR